MNLKDIERTIICRGKQRSMVMADWYCYGMNINGIAKALALAKDFIPQ